MMDSRYPVLFAQNNGMKRDEMKKPLLNSALAVCTAVAGWMPCWRWLEECAWFLGPLNVKCRSNLLQLINLQTTTSNQFYRDSAVSSQVADTHWMFHLPTLYLTLSCRFKIVKVLTHNNDNVMYSTKYSWSHNSCETCNVLLLPL